MKELDRIIDVGIVNAKHDSDILRHVQKQLKESDLDAMIRIIKPVWKGKFDIQEDDGNKDIVLREFDHSVVLCFDKEGRLIG